MRIAIVAFDTRGGVQPYAALAVGLAGAGHDVRIVTTADFVPLLESRGVAVAPIAGDARAFAEASDSLAEMGPLEAARAMRSLTRDLVINVTGETHEACVGAELITGGIGGMAVARPVAERLGVGFLPALLQPIGPPTAAFPGVFVPGVPRWLGATGRRASHAVTRLALSQMLRPAERGARTEVLGLPARPSPVHPELPVVYGFSRHVVPSPPEWGPEHHVTGYWTLPATDEWSPPRAALAAFVAADPPPVCIGFGSMTSRDPAVLTDLVVEAVRGRGMRAILLSGWGGLSDAGGGDDVMVTDEVPHEWLFPRVAAVVHHGGAGTTGAALRAGVPSVVVPFGVDQPFWAAQVTALGAGPPPIPRRRLSVTALGDALETVLADTAMRDRARALGARICTEDGVAEAVAVYGRVAHRPDVTARRRLPAVAAECAGIAAGVRRAVCRGQPSTRTVLSSGSRPPSPHDPTRPSTRWPSRWPAGGPAPLAPRSRWCQVKPRVRVRWSARTAR